MILFPKIVQMVSSSMPTLGRSTQNELAFPSLLITHWLGPGEYPLVLLDYVCTSSQVSLLLEGPHFTRGGEEEGYTLPVEGDTFQCFFCLEPSKLRPPKLKLSPSQKGAQPKILSKLNIREILFIFDWFIRWYVKSFIGNTFLLWWLERWEVF